MTFPAQAMQILVELQVGEDAAWVDVTEDLRMSSGVNITRGRQDEASEVNPGQCVMVLNNRHGKYSEFNPLGPYYGRLTRNTPIRVSVAPFGDGVYYPRFAGEVSKWPPRWDVSDTDVWVSIEAAGILRRIRASSERPVSALQRHIRENNPIAYWPMTDPEGANEASAEVGVAPLRSLGQVTNALFADQPEWGRGNLAAWMDPVAFFVIGAAPSEGRTLTARLPAFPQGGLWSVEWSQNGFTWSDNGIRFVCPTDGDPVRQLSIGVDNVSTEGDAFFTVIIEDDTEVLAETPIFEVITKQGLPGPHMFRVTFDHTSSTSVTVTAYMDGEQVATGVAALNDYLVPVSFRLDTNPNMDGPGDLAIGHLVMYAGSEPDSIDSYRALFGYSNEKAGRRIERLCAEREIRVEFHGDVDLTLECGPQQMKQFSELIQDAADVDGGTLGESTEDLALLYRTQRSRYNQGEVL